MKQTAPGPLLDRVMYYARSLDSNKIIGTVEALIVGRLPFTTLRKAIVTYPN